MSPVVPAAAAGPWLTAAAVGTVSAAANPAAAPLGLLPSDPVFLGMLALILLFFFFLFLMIRRTVTAFREGTGGRNR